ncbi:MAG TPA: sugar phosphate nucleotidyltransferase [Acidimicrobiales bacterium]|nr:sugar phosphate nucleotidyltransferase [Acidimicrobiales bacterium]
MSTRPVAAIVLAAGEGVRMRSDRPKPLHLLCGRPMIMHMLGALTDLSVRRTVVVTGHGSERVTKKVQDQSPPSLHVTFVEQPVQRGTGDAVSVGLTAFPDDDVDDTSTVIVLPGDHPLLRPQTLTALVAEHEKAGNAATVLSARVDDPNGYGRVIRGRDGRVTHIVEHRDASADELAVNEINTSIYCFRRDLLGPALRRLSPDNAQGEYYLTDVISVLALAGYPVGSMVLPDGLEALGVNDRAQLAFAEAELRARTNRRWLLAGVTMVDPAETYVDVTVALGRDVTLFPGTMLQGRTVIGAGSEIGPDTRLVDCTVGVGAVVEHSVGHNAEIGEGARVGPYAALSPGTIVPAWSVTGPFYTGPT